MDSTVAIDQPIGHAAQIPVEEWVILDNIKANITRRIKSVNVATINWRMALVPRRTPSATNLADITK